MKRTKAVMGVVALALGIVATISITNSGADTAVKPKSAIDTSVDKNIGQFSPAAKAESDLQDYLATIPDTNNGVYGDDPAKAITVHLVTGVKPDAGMLAAVEAVETAGIKVSYDTVLRSKADLDKTLAEVCTSTVRSCYANPQTDQIEITVSSENLTAIRSSVDSSVKVIVDDSPLPALAQRYNDTLPVLGSDFIAGYNGTSNYGVCTLGFEVHASTGSHYGLTAGHCSAGMNQSFGMPWYTSGPGGCCYKFIGNYSFTRYCNGSGCYDGELLYNTASPNYTPYIWIGTGNSSVARHVTGAYNALINANVYNDGAITGQSAIVKVKQGPYCQAFSAPGGNITTCGIYRVQATTTNSACTQGDSGGPVFAPDGAGTGVVAIGIMTGDDNGGALNTVCYYTSVPTLLSSFGMFIST